MNYTHLVNYMECPKKLFVQRNSTASIKKVTLGFFKAVATYTPVDLEISKLIHTPPLT